MLPQQTGLFNCDVTALVDFLTVPVSDATIMIEVLSNAKQLDFAGRVYFKRFLLSQKGRMSQLV
jgi:hypothetical protein